MKIQLGRKQARGIPCASISGKTEWIPAGLYWFTVGRLTKLVTKSGSVLTSEWYQIGPESPIPLKQNQIEHKRLRKQRLNLSC